MSTHATTVARVRRKLARCARYDYYGFRLVKDRSAWADLYQVVDNETNGVVFGWDHTADINDCEAWVDRWLAAAQSDAA